MEFWLTLGAQVGLLVAVAVVLARRAPQDALVWYLYEQSDPECWKTASELSGRINNNEILFANNQTWVNGKEYAGVYNHPDASQDADRVILSPSLANSVFEQRSTIIHEGYHARGFWSKDEATSSICEWQASTVGSGCS